MYYIYHIPGKKIGVTSDLDNRVTKIQGYRPEEYEVLDSSENIEYISNREIELQKLYGYSVDQTLYANLFKITERMINSTEQTSTFPWPKSEMKEKLKQNIGLSWTTPLGDFKITESNSEWLYKNSYRSQFDSSKSYIYNKALLEHTKQAVIKWEEPVRDCCLGEYKPFDNIRCWATDRGIYDKGDVKTQYAKLMEEAGELAKAILNQDQAELVDAIGDCVVVLTNLAYLAGTDIEHCVESAYNEIKSRKGKMSNGTFVKETL